MIRRNRIFVIATSCGLLLILSIVGCKKDTPQPKIDSTSESLESIENEVSAMSNTGGTFGDDVAFLRKHTDIIVLSGADGQACVAVSAKHQGRVYTSSLAGEQGDSFGWINYKAVASGENNKHINAYGGEERLWLGPEGGQFSIFFKKDDPFDLDHWFTPEPINEEPWDIVIQETERVVFKKGMHLTNYSGTDFTVGIDREVRLLSNAEIAETISITSGASVKVVGYATENKITNVSDAAWVKESGLLSLWVLGMLNASPTTTMVVPCVSGDEAQLGPVVNDRYFGKVPAERLVVKENVIYFNGDANHRSKIGLRPQRAKNILGSYDISKQVLTLVQYNQPTGITDYVNSMWEIQDKPYGGDVVNCYNDGPSEPGGEKFGDFYELETSSPAATLKPGESLIHIHRTFHFQGEEKDLDGIARTTLGVGIVGIKGALQ